MGWYWVQSSYFILNGFWDFHCCRGRRAGGVRAGGGNSRHRRNFGDTHFHFDDMKRDAIDFNVVTVSCGNKHAHLKWTVSRNGINDGDGEARQIWDGGKKLAGVNQVAAARRIETG